MKTTIVKTSFLAAIMFVAFTLSAFAKPNDVSKYLMKEFQKQFHHATNVTWKTTNNFTSATFMLDGTKTAVFYNINNDFVGISRDITVQDLPKATQRLLNKKYAGQAIASIIDFTDANSNENYYIQLDGNAGKTVILQADEAGNVNAFQK